MAENKKSFIVYANWRDTFEALPDDKAGELIKHIFAYVNDENPETDDVLINAVFANIRNQLKADLKKWEQLRNQRVEAGKKSAEVRKRNAATVNERSVSSTVNVNVNDNVNKSSSKKRFTPPSVDEVKAYCDERGNSVDPERFVDFYASKGWKVGKNAMKDWKAAVRNWERDDKQTHKRLDKTGDKLVDYVNEQIKRYDTKEGQQ